MLLLPTPPFPDNTSIMFRMLSSGIVLAKNRDSIFKDSGNGGAGVFVVIELAGLVRQVNGLSRDRDTEVVRELWV